MTGERQPLVGAGGVDAVRRPLRVVVADGPGRLPVAAYCIHSSPSVAAMASTMATSTRAATPWLRRAAMAATVAQAAVSPVPGSPMAMPVSAASPPS